MQISLGDCYGLFLSRLYSNPLWFFNPLILTQGSRFVLVKLGKISLHWPRSLFPTSLCLCFHLVSYYTLPSLCCRLSLSWGGGGGIDAFHLAQISLLYVRVMPISARLPLLGEL